MYRPVRTDAPTSLPVTRDEVKDALDISYTDKDELIDGLIAAAVSYLDGWTGILGRALCEQSWRQDYDYFCWQLRLPMFPVISVDAVKYLDVNGDEREISDASWALRTDSLGAHVAFVKSFSFPNIQPLTDAAVWVEYTCGHEEGDDLDPLPAAIKQAILLLIRHWFDNPSAVVIGVTVDNMPFAVEALLAPYRRIRF